jgi:hypothetical protein
MGNQRRIADAAALLVLVGSWTFLPTWAFYPLALVALVALFSSLRPTSSRIASLTRGAALAAVVVAGLVTALAGVDRFAAPSDVAIVAGSWAVVAALWVAALWSSRLSVTQR